MNSVLTKILFCSVIIFFSTFANAQQEKGDFGKDSKIIKTSTVRSRPTNRSTVVAVLEPNDKVRIIEPQPRSGYYIVLFGQGDIGFVWHKNVETERGVADDFIRAAPDLSLTTLRTAREEGPCNNLTNFSQCEPRGCGEPGSKMALFNEAKRLPPSGAFPIKISFNDLRKMQDALRTRLDKAGQNKSLSAEERTRLQNIQVRNGFVGEKTLVQVTGYIPLPVMIRTPNGQKKESGLKAGSIETVNCKFSEIEQKDIHIPLTTTPRTTEYQGIVIEMIPQNRKPGWNLAKLKLVRDRQRLVLVEGGLFYDNEHVINNNPAIKISGHSKRFTIWEIHPVTKFYVCAKADNSCNSNSLSDWVPLEEY